MTTAPDEAGGGVPLAPAHADVVPGGVLTRRAPATAFEVTLDNFSGPFDLLLGLISKHKLDITEIALATVTDDFIAHIRAEQAKPGGWDLSQATEFLLVAATLLDLKAARLLPQSGPEDEEDLALIEARDILFARLLQYRAFKDIAHTFAERMATAGRMQPRTASLEPHLAALLPELLMTVTPGAARPDRGPGDGAQAGARPSGWPTCTRPRSACASRPASSATGCAASGWRRSAAWWPTPTPPSSSSPASSPCSSCSARRRSASSRPRRSAS